MLCSTNEIILGCLRLQNIKSAHWWRLKSVVSLSIPLILNLPHMTTPPPPPPLLLGPGCTEDEFVGFCVGHWNIICNINKNLVSGSGDHVKAGICGFPSRFLCVYLRHLARIYKYKCIISSWQHGHQVPSRLILAGYYFWSSFLCFVYSITANRWFK